MPPQATNFSPRRQPYVRQDGRLVRSRTSFSLARCLLLAASLLVLIATNPGNEDFLRHLFTGADRNAARSSWFSSLLRPEDTNYGLFLLSKSLDGISIQALRGNFQVCDFTGQDDLVVAACDWIGDTFCHGKPLLDLADLPYTTCRLLCCLLILSLVTPFCTRGQSIFQSQNTVVDSLVSVMDRPHLMDIVWIQSVLYQALQYMDRLGAIHSGIRNARGHFVFSAFLIVFGVGAISNAAATSWIQQRLKVRGMTGVFAASLGYVRSVHFGPQTLDLLGVYISCSTLFWLEASRYIFYRQYGELIAWFVGAVLGHALGQVHELSPNDSVPSVVRGIRQILFQNKL